MLESRLILDTQILNDNHENLDDVLRDTNIDTEDLRTIANDTNWLKNYKENDIKELVYQLGKIEGLADIEIKDKDVEYSSNNLMKKTFLIYLSEKWESPITMGQAFNTMEEIDKLEDSYGKTILEFSDADMQKIIIDLFDEMKYYKLRYQINILTRYQNFYKNQVENHGEWKKFRDTKVLKELIGDGAKEHILTRKDLIDLTRVVPNIQDSIIPLLIFEGVAFSKVDDIDEIRYLKATDLDGNFLNIEGNGSDENTKRAITLSTEVSELVQDAIVQDYYERKVRYDTNLVELQDTEYILRASTISKKRKDVDSNLDVISFRGAYSRMNVCKEYMESMLYDIPFTPKAIETSGKVFYINKFVNEGFDEIEAVVKTLKRFGNWYLERDGKRDPKNAQQINRLRKVWSLYV